MKPIINLITNRWIADNKPCQEALDLWQRKERNPLKILKWLIKIKKYDWANWFIVRIMSYKDYASYAVYAAELVINIYENKYPNDKRPREAIEKAKECIKNPTIKNKNAVYAAANDVAYAAANVAYAAAYDAAYATIYAAYVVVNDAANDAANDAYAAACAANAVYAAYAAANAANKTKLKIIKYGIRLLENKEKK